MGMILRAFLIFVVSMVAYVAQGAFPPFQGFYGTGGITVATNIAAGTVIIGGAAGGGASSTNTSGNGMSNLLWGRTLFVDSINGNNTTARRGDAAKPWLYIQNALSNALESDTVFIRPGVYKITNVNLSVPHGVGLVGAGPKETRIENWGSGTAIGAMINPGSHSYIANLSVSNTLGSGTLQYPIGVYVTAAGGVNKLFTNAVVNNVEMWGVTDMATFSHDDFISMDVYDSKFAGSWDGFIWRADLTGIDNNSKLNFYSSSFNFLSSVGSSMIMCGQESGVATFNGCTFIVTNLDSGLQWTAYSKTASVADGGHAEFNACNFLIATNETSYALSPGGIFPNTVNFNGCTLNGQPLTFTQPVRGISAGNALVDFKVASVFTNTFGFSTNLYLTNMANRVRYKMLFRAAPGTTFTFPQFVANDWIGGYIPYFTTNRVTWIEAWRVGTVTNLWAPEGESFMGLNDSDLIIGAIGAAPYLTSLRFYDGTGLMFTMDQDANGVETFTPGGDNGTLGTTGTPFSNVVTKAVSVVGTGGATATIGGAPTNSVAVTNWLGVIHLTAAAVMAVDFNKGAKYTVTNLISAATSLIYTNGSDGQNSSVVVNGEVAGGTSRVVTIVANTGQLIVNLDDYSAAAATSYAFTLTNGNMVWIDDEVRRSNGTNTHYIVTRQAKR